METPSPYQDKERFPVTPAARHIIMRSYPSGKELQASHAQMERGWSHVRPNSVLVAAMGNHWRGASWNKVIDMLDFTQQNGVYCALSEIQDRCFNPYDALGTMRNEAIFNAMIEGFEYILYLDNDVQPENDHLLKLLQWQMPIVAPFIVEPGTGKKLFGPDLQPNSGLQRAKWSVLSMLLFNMRVFHATGPEFWRDAVGADEGYHFQKLYYHGFHLHIDTSVQPTVGGRPLFPLALNRLSSGSMRDVEQAAKGVSAHVASILGRRNIPLLEADQNELTGALTEFIRISKGDRDILLQQKIERFTEMPDRRPIDPNSPWIKDGEYAPFLVRMEQERAKQQAQQQTPGTAQPAGGSDGVEKVLAFSGAGNG